MPAPKVVLIGAGITGLLIAYLARLRGANVFLVEESSATGGLARNSFGQIWTKKIWSTLVRLKQDSGYTSQRFEREFHSVSARLLQNIEPTAIISTDLYELEQLASIPNQFNHEGYVIDIFSLISGLRRQLNELQINVTVNHAVKSGDVDYKRRLIKVGKCELQFDFVISKAELLCCIPEYIYTAKFPYNGNSISGYSKREKVFFGRCGPELFAVGTSSVAIDRPIRSAERLRLASNFFGYSCPGQEQKFRIRRSYPQKPIVRSRGASISYHVGTDYGLANAVAAALSINSIIFNETPLSAYCI